MTRLMIIASVLLAIATAAIADFPYMNINQECGTLRSKTERDMATLVAMCQNIPPAAVTGIDADDATLTPSWCPKR